MMRYRITREFFEVFEIEAEDVHKAIAIMDECNTEPVEVVYGEIVDWEEIGNEQS